VAKTYLDRLNKKGCQLLGYVGTSIQGRRLSPRAEISAAAAAASSAVIPESRLSGDQSEIT
jgi:hypothetical protein